VKKVEIVVRILYIIEVEENGYDIVDKIPLLSKWTMRMIEMIKKRGFLLFIIHGHIK
jgi:hypothetical protein